MLAICQFDAASASVLDRLFAAGRLPTLDALRARGMWHELDAPATQFAAGAQHTLYSGVELEDHGLFYPFQWDPAEQRVHYMAHFAAPPPVWEQLGSRGTRTLAVDPYESRPPTTTPPGTYVCGWQLHDRVVLRQWDRPDGVHRRLERLHGPPQPVDEVFGLHTADEMLALRRRLLGAPARVADAGALFLGEDSFDLAWLTFCAAHVAGHQFFDLSQIDPAGLDRDAERLLGRTLDDVYVAVDTALGRVVDALPEGTDLMVISPVGMEINTSRADMLPDMLEAVLDPREERTDRSSSIWRLRAALPSDLRARVATALPEKVALDLTARLELHGVDWSRTRAFAHPAETRATCASTSADASATGSSSPTTPRRSSTRSPTGWPPSATPTGAPRSTRSSGSPTASVTATARTCSPTSSSAGLTARRRRSTASTRSGSAPCDATASAAGGRATTPRATPGPSSSRAAHARSPRRVPHASRTSRRPPPRSAVATRRPWSASHCSNPDRPLRPGRTVGSTATRPRHPYRWRLAPPPRASPSGSPGGSPSPANRGRSARARDRRPCRRRRRRAAPRP
ncbi:MAG: alkaline phosphatase family protein [Acidimicrobiia bacterium]|nr:alkaline phosphatase family protein [Acidimicrobiia bacterium]